MPWAALTTVIAAITIAYLAAAEMAKRVVLSDWQIRKWKFDVRQTSKRLRVLASVIRFRK